MALLRNNNPACAGIHSQLLKYLNPAQKSSKEGQNGILRDHYQPTTYLGHIFNKYKNKEGFGVNSQEMKDKATQNNCHAL